MKYIRNMALTTLLVAQTFVPAMADPSRVETEAYIEGFVSKHANCSDSVAEYYTIISVAGGVIEATEEIRDGDIKPKLSKTRISILDVGEVGLLAEPSVRDCSVVLLSCSGGDKCARRELVYTGGEFENWTKMDNGIVLHLGATPEALEKLSRALKHYNDIYGGVLSQEYDEDTF